MAAFSWMWTTARGAMRALMGSFSAVGAPSTKWAGASMWVPECSQRSRRFP